jgi:histidyl-tRNA synthetase
MGVERVALLLSDKDFTRRPDLFIAALGTEARALAFKLMGELQVKGVSVEIDYDGKSLKSQLRRSDKFNSCFTLVIGEDEMAKGTAQFKDMDKGTQADIRLDASDIFAALRP